VAVGPCGRPFVAASPSFTHSFNHCSLSPSLTGARVRLARRPERTRSGTSSLSFLCWRAASILTSMRRSSGSSIVVFMWLSFPKNQRPVQSPAGGHRGEERPRNPLLGATRELWRKLNDEKRRLFVPHATKGILDDRTPLSQVQLALFSLDSSWDLPDPTQRAELQQAETATAAELQAVNCQMSEVKTPTSVVTAELERSYALGYPERLDHSSDSQRAPRWRLESPRRPAGSPQWPPFPEPPLVQPISERS
jgi:hypothetical protein